MVAATASGQSHLDAAVYLEEKHFLQGLVLRDTAFIFTHTHTRTHTHTPEIANTGSGTAYLQSRTAFSTCTVESKLAAPTQNQ